MKTAIPATPLHHLLIVDDDKVNRLVATRLLQRLGYTCDVVENGAQALEAIAAKQYDLVLMDCHMPVMDGFQATTQIRTTLSPAQRPVIVATTASVLPKDRQQCIEAGMNDYLPKPIKVPELLEILHKWLGSGVEHLALDNSGIA